jgi:ProP effector
MNPTNSLVSSQLNANKKRALEDTIAALAELFPAAFTADRWLPHKPLKLGIHLDLIARGVLLRKECHLVLGRYCPRREYQAALVAGGVRVDLDGNPSGEVTATEQERAKSVIAHLDALMVEKAVAAKAAAKAGRAKRASKAPARPPAKAKSASALADPKQRSGLADLRRAAAERKQAGIR